MILRIIVVVGALIAALLIFATTKPATLRIQRSTVVNAPPERVFALVNDLHNWQDWNEEETKDATETRTFSGPASGGGAACQWNSRGKAGKGWMVITESRPSSKVAVTVDFVKPFESHNINEFTLEPAGTSTRLVWSWQRQNLYFMKVMGIFVNMDKMIGKHFENGLANLKNLAEK